MINTVSYLIENRQGGSTKYFCGGRRLWGIGPKKAYYSRNVDDAVRFNDYTDATIVAEKLNLKSGKVAEHAFLDFDIRPRFW